MSKRSQQHYSRPDKLRQRREDEKIVKSHDGCMSRSLVSSAPLPEAAGFFTSKCMAACAAFASPPRRPARLERTVHRLHRGNENPQGSQTGLPRLKQRFTGYTAATRTPGSQTGLPRLKPRFTGYDAATRTPGSQTGLPRLKQRFTGYTAATRTPALPDGLVPSEAKVHGLGSEPASTVRDKPVGGCSGVGGGGERRTFSSDGTSPSGAVVALVAGG